MKNEGPALETLIRRLAETPADFLAEPRIRKEGRVAVAAVVQDLLIQLGKPVDPDRLASFAGEKRAKDRNKLAVALVLCWLLADEWFSGEQMEPDAILELLTAKAAELAQHVPSGSLVSDPERREEAVRLTLGHLGYRPAGESIAQAQDRLTSISSTERARVLAASRAAEERAREVREALRRKAAEESADKWTRE